jgi:transposase
MTWFPTLGDLASWVGLCPGSYESAGKPRPLASTAGNQWLRRALVEADRAAARTKHSYFAAQYRQIACRRGPNKAAVAVAHSLIELVWHLLSTGEVYKDLSEDYFTNRQDPERARVVGSRSSKLGDARELHRRLRPLVGPIVVGRPGAGGRVTSGQSRSPALDPRTSASTA